jgi:hypothetical protein
MLIRAFLLFSCLLAWFSMPAQDRVDVYPDDRLMWGDVLFHSENGLVREGNHWRGQVLWTLQPGRIYAGYSSSSFDLQFTVRDGQLIQGDSQFSDAILYTLDGYELFIGDSRFALDLVYTLRPDPMRPELLGLYKEDSISYFDRICIFQGIPTPGQLFALLMAQGLL